MFILRGNGYGTLPQPGWQWKNCPSPVAPLEPKVFESMDQKRSGTGEGAHHSNPKRRVFLLQSLPKGCPRAQERSRQLGESNASQTARALAGSTSCSGPLSQREPVPIWRPGMYWPSQPPSAHRGPWSTRHNRNPPATVLYSPKKRAVFPTKRIFCWDSPFLQHSLSKGRGQGIQSPNGQVLIQKKKVHGSAHLCMIGLHEEPSDIGIKTEMDLSFYTRCASFFFPWHTPRRS